MLYELFNSLRYVSFSDILEEDWAQAKTVKSKRPWCEAWGWHPNASPFLDDNGSTNLVQSSLHRFRRVFDPRERGVVPRLFLDHHDDPIRALDSIERVSEVPSFWTSGPWLDRLSSRCGHVNQPVDRIASYYVHFRRLSRSHRLQAVQVIWWMKNSYGTKCLLDVSS